MHPESVREISHSAEKVRVSGISFAELPGQSALFTRYLADPSSLRSFYPNAVDSPLGTADFIPTVLENYRTDRELLSQSLIRTNKTLGAQEPTLRNIDLLRDPGCVAIVTGQQAGLFSGPLYTIYKALSAIRLASVLRDRGQMAVPVFWIATEDHDFEEVSSAGFLSTAGSLRHVHYEPAGRVAGSAVGEVSIDAGIEPLLASLLTEMPEREFSEYTAQTLSRSWQPGVSWGTSFGRTIIELLGKFGLIVLDPLDRGIKDLSAPIYLRSIENAEKIVASLQARNAELASAGFHSQVLVEEDHFPLFWHDDKGVRTALRKKSSGIYQAKGSRKEFSLDELKGIAAEAPHRLSPGVMLRPVVQDYLLPSAAYFGGGAEIAYFAQNSAVYEALGRPVTPVFHRQSFTVVEARHRRTMEKFGLAFSDLFREQDEVIMEWAAINVDPKTAALFAAAEESINIEMHKIDQHLAAIDTTLLHNAAKRRRKMIYHIGAIRQKALRALARNHGDAERRINGLFADLMPEGKLQERSVNVFTFLNSFGPGLIDHLYDAVDLDDNSHRIIYL